jgi:hypothetical protein
MPYITSIERIGYERGRKERLKDLITLQLEQKIGSLSDVDQNRVSELSDKTSDPCDRTPRFPIHR